MTQLENMQARLRTDVLATDREHDLATLLLHIAVSSPTDAAELSARLGRPQQAVHEDLTALMRDGLVHLHDGALRTSAAQRVLVDAHTATVREIQHQVLTGMLAGGPARVSTLQALAESGCSDESLLDLLTRAVGDDPGDAVAQTSFSLVARARGEGETAQRVRRARDAARRCRSTDVLTLTEPVLDTEPSAERDAAALLAAGAHIHGNRLERAGALCSHIGTERIGVNGAWGVVVAVGQGDVAAAQAWRDAMPSNSLTSYAAGLSDLADGLIASVSGNGEAALDLLARSSTALAPLGDNHLLPESPAALAAFIALGRGEPGTAEILLTRALRTGLGGEAGRRRHALLLAWGQLVQGKLESAEQKLRSLPEPRDLSERDLLLYRCVQGGIARRRTDAHGMQQSWREIAGQVFGMRITLYDLLPLGEMLALATRLRDAERIAPLIEQAHTLLESLGNPPVWAAPLLWQGVQAAFQAEDPAALLPYANALASAGSDSGYAAKLASAGNTWLEVLRGEADASSVERCVRELAMIGHTWEASRLAGQAALQHPERESALSLMQLAREAMKDYAPGAGTSGPSPLTAREAEVARLVLDGHGYRAVGEQLFISPKTVEHHVARIRNRLGATSRAELLEKLHDVLSMSR